MVTHAIMGCAGIISKSCETSSKLCIDQALAYSMGEGASLERQETKIR